MAFSIIFNVHVDILIESIKVLVDEINFVYRHKFVLIDIIEVIIYVMI